MRINSIIRKYRCINSYSTITKGLCKTHIKLIDWCFRWQTCISFTSIPHVFRHRWLMQVQPARTNGLKIYYSKRFVIIMVKMINVTHSVTSSNFYKTLWSAVERRQVIYINFVNVVYGQLNSMFGRDQCSLIYAPSADCDASSSTKRILIKCVDYIIEWILACDFTSSSLRSCFHIIIE